MLNQPIQWVDESIRFILSVGHGALTAECPYTLVREMLLNMKQMKFEYLANVILDLVLTRKCVGCVLFVGRQSMSLSPETLAYYSILVAINYLPSETIVPEPKPRNPIDYRESCLCLRLIGLLFNSLLPVCNSIFAKISPSPPIVKKNESADALGEKLEKE